ncbi:CK5P3 protein, partial [Rhabdornis inornatus]|nr:CK5P3 protein [Rhabdornis inornatus]
EDVRRELLAQVQALPSLLSRVGDGASALGDAIELYEASVAFVCDRSPLCHPLSPFVTFCPSGGRWHRLGRWREGENHSRAQSPVSPFVPQGDDGIDWGDGGGQEGTITVVEAGTEGGFGSGQGFGALARGFWVPWGDPELASGSQPTLPSPPAPEGVARGSDALTLLENAETRNQFIDELMELELFLAQRLLEMEDEADVVAMSQLQLAPAVLQGQSSERVRALLATTRELLAQLCSRSVQHLCMILASPR